jgi:hypothetical protein
MVMVFRSGAAALLLGLAVACAPYWARAENAGGTQASQAGQSQQFDSIKVTLESFAFQGAKGDVMLRMDNLAEEEKSIALLLFIEAQSESGEFGDYDYAKTNCDGTIPPKGTFKCKLSLIFPAAPKQVTLRVGEGMGGEVVTFSLPAGTP